MISTKNQTEPTGENEVHAYERAGSSSQETDVLVNEDDGGVGAE